MRRLALVASTVVVVASAGCGEDPYPCRAPVLLSAPPAYAAGDLNLSDGPKDGSGEDAILVDAGTDMADSGADLAPPPVGCSGADVCLDNCISSDTSTTDHRISILCPVSCRNQFIAACLLICKSGTTTEGWSLLIAKTNCLFNACSPVNGGICDPSTLTYKSGACDGCLSDAQRPGGACYGETLACQESLP